MNRQAFLPSRLTTEHFLHQAYGEVRFESRDVLEKHEDEILEYAFCFLSFFLHADSVY